MSQPTPLVAVIDDDPSVRKAPARLLRAAGFRAETFASVTAFLRGPLQDEPACVIADVQMPGLTGLDLQRALAADNAANFSEQIRTHIDLPRS